MCNPWFVIPSLAVARGLCSLPPASPSPALSLFSANLHLCGIFRNVHMRLRLSSSKLVPEMRGPLVPAS